MAFKLPLNFESLEQERSDGRYFVAEVKPVKRLEEPAQIEELDALQRALAGVLDGGGGSSSSSSSSATQLDEAFDLAYAFVKELQALPDAVRSKLTAITCKFIAQICTIVSAKFSGQAAAAAAAAAAAVDDAGAASSSGFQSEMALLRRALTMGVCLVSQIARDGLIGALRSVNKSDSNDMVAGGARKKGSHAAKKRQKEAASAWTGDCLTALRALNGALDVDFHRLWPGHAVEEDLLALFCKVGYEILPHKLILETSADFKGEVVQIISHTASRFPGTMSAAITSQMIPLLRDHEHLAGPIAAIVVQASMGGTTSAGENAAGDAIVAATVVAAPANNGLAAELLGEIGHFGEQDSSGIRNLGHFVMELAEQSPACMLNNVRTVLPLLNNGDADAHSMRSSVCSALGSVITAFKDESFGPTRTEGATSDARAKTLDTFLNVLYERKHDVSGYVRSACLKTWLALCKEDAIPLDWLARVAELAVDRINDKSSLVRRNALLLLGELVVRNKFWKSLDPEYFYEKIEEATDFLKEKGCDTTAIDVLLLDPDAEDDSEEGEQAASADGAPAEKGEEDVDMSEKEGEISSSSADGASSEQNNDDDDDQGMGISDDDDSDQDDDEEDASASGSRRDARQQDNKKPARDLTPQEQLEVSNQLRALKMYQKAVSFICLLDECAPAIESLLRSKTLSDVVETLRFIRRTFAFEIPSVCRLARSMMSLAWSSKEEIKKEIVATFQELYINVPGTDGARRRSGEEIAMQLVYAVDGIESEAELASFEELMKLVVAAGNKTEATSSSSNKKQPIKVLPKSTIKTLWLIARKCTTLAPPDASLNPEAAAVRKALDERIACGSLAAVKVLAMAASADPALLAAADKIEALGAIGFGDSTAVRRNWNMAQQVAVALQCVPEVGFSSAPKNKRLRMALGERPAPQQLGNDEAGAPAKKIAGEVAEDLVRKIEKVIVGSGSWKESGENEALFFGAAQQCIQAIYHMSPRPEVPCERIVKRMSSELFGGAKGPGNQVPLQPLSRFVYVVGEVAIAQLAHMERLAVATKKRRLYCEENDITSSKAKKGDEMTEEEDREEGLDAMLGSNDAEGDKELDHYEESAHKIISPGSGSMLAPYTSLIVEIAKSLIPANSSAPKKTVSGEDAEADEAGEEEVAVDGEASSTAATAPTTGPQLLLMEAASLTLTKFMCISEDFCKNNLRLLFTALKRCPAPTVRCNIVVALGDMYARFPNALTPWSQHLFARLRDPHVSVRKSSLMVISHMILNGVLKGRGQMAPVAACLEDTEPKVSDLARLFFHELSKRAGNPIYNLLPDTISQLSKDDAVTPTKFKSIFKFLLSFISKDAQTVALVGKLCQRFAESMEPQAWRDIAYCLTQLPYNARCVAKIIENFAFYKMQVQDDLVFECFTTIATKARKTNAKADTTIKESIEEWCTKIDRLHQGLSEEAEQTVEAVEQAEAEAYENAAPEEAHLEMETGGKSAEAAEEEEEEEESSSEEEDEEVVKKSKPRVKKLTAAAKKKAAAAKKKKAAAAAKKKKAAAAAKKKKAAAAAKKKKAAAAAKKKKGRGRKKKVESSSEEEESSSEEEESSSEEESSIGELSSSDDE